MMMTECDYSDESDDELFIQQQSASSRHLFCETNNDTNNYKNYYLNENKQNQQNQIDIKPIHCRTLIYISETFENNTNNKLYNFLLILAVQIKNI